MSCNTQEASEIRVSSKIDRTALTETLSLSLYMTEVLHLVMMKTHRNFGCLPLDGFKGITPVKTKLQNFNTIFTFFWMVKCILTRNGTSTRKNWT